MDVLVTKQSGSVFLIRNTNTVSYGTSLHLRITDPNGINVYYGNTVKLYNSAGVLVATQIINPQSGMGVNDTSALVNFYGLNAGETYNAVLIKSTGTTASNIDQTVNTTWGGLQATDATHAYDLSAEAGTASNNGKFVGTGYNDTFFATAGTDTYDGSGGWVAPVMLSGAYLQRAGVFSLQQPMPPGIKPPQHCASPEPFRLAADSTTVFLFRNPSRLHSVLRIPQNIIRLQSLHFSYEKGMGTGVGGVMARTLPRDLYERTQLRHANSLLNMGILVSPLLAPLIGGLLDTMWNWRACYLFLLVLCAGVTFSMARWMPETRPVDAPRTRLLTSYKTLFGNGGFNCYLLMLIGGLAGIAAFEACSGVLMGAVLGLSSMTVSILFILPIPAAFFGAWFAGRPNKRFSTLMWQSVICCLLAGLLMWIPELQHRRLYDARRAGHGLLA